MHRASRWHITLQHVVCALTSLGACHFRAEHTLKYREVKDFSCSITMHILQKLTKIKGISVIPAPPSQTCILRCEWDKNWTNSTERNLFDKKTNARALCRRWTYFWKICSTDLWKLNLLFLFLIAHSMLYHYTEESNITQQTLYFLTITQENHLREIDTDATKMVIDVDN